jgi:hypothetical protein
MKRGVFVLMCLNPLGLRPSGRGEAIIAATALLPSHSYDGVAIAVENRAGISKFFAKYVLKGVV